MKTLRNITSHLLLLGILLFSLSCEKEKDWSDDYNIDWPVPTVTQISSNNAVLSSTLNLQGNFTEVTKVMFGDVTGDNLIVANDGQSLTVDVPRTINPTGAQITVENAYRRSFTVAETFVPIIPETTISSVEDIQAGLTFDILGENVDLLTEIKVNGTVVPVISKSPTKIIVSVEELVLSPGQLANVSSLSLANNPIPTFEKIDVIYPFIIYKEVTIFGFEDGIHQYAGEGDITIEEGDVLGRTEKYFALRAPGYGWDQATGEMTSNEVPDISTIVNPYLTFCVRTPAGSAGYFQMEDQQGQWRHFNYGFNTGGEWMVVSQPLNESWEGGGEFNAGAFMPKLSFKAGNAGEKQDLDIAYVKITEGPYDGVLEVGDKIGGSAIPAKIIVMDFENPEEWSDVMNGENKIAAIDLRNGVNAYMGNHSFSYIDDGSQGAWGAYWGGTISKDISDVNLKAFADPHLSFALNSTEGQYVMIRIHQFGEKLNMVQKFFPNTGGEWQNFQFSLFNTELENWSDDSTDLGAHYKSLKRLSHDHPIDRIEIIIGKNDANEIGVSIDEMVITEGPRF